MTAKAPVSLRQIVTASTAGTILEWYDFFLYGFTAALVFGKLYFPNYSPLTATLASFGTLAVGFVARPLGAILFGHFGDRIGRKKTLVVTLSMMGGATFLIGCLPTYEQIGIAAPILLTLLRFLQGIGLGGEWGGAVLMTLENSPSNRRGFMGSVVQLGALLGLVLAVGVLLIGAALPGEHFITWGWRIPFLASAILLMLGLYIRLNIDETPAFKKIQATGKVVRMPIGEVIRKFPKETAITACLYLGGITVPFYTVWVFLIYYTTAVLKLPRTDILIGVIVVNVFSLLIAIAGGALSDRYGRKTIFFLGTVLVAAAAFPFFWLADTKQTYMVWLAMLVLAGPLWFVWGALPAFFAEMFPAEVRYTGVAFGSQIATIIGGLVPMYATALFPIYGTLPVSLLVIGCAVISLIALASIGLPAPDRVRAMLNEV
jgi:MFS family permease